MNSINPQWVDNDQQLATLCASWMRQPIIGVDTEFMRSDTFFPHIGLLQIADADGAYLIDPLKIRDKSSLIEVLQQPSVIKVIHSCSQDLAVFHHYLGIFPEPIFDTQVAAAFVGHGLAISYANLLKNLLDIDIPKQETRSNWLQRPLSNAQLHYAALDAFYLLPIYHQMRQELEQQQRLDWVESECQQLLGNIRQSLEQTNYYTRIKSAWKLDRQQLAILAKICGWREQQARERDVPRNRILEDNFIWELAATKPQSNSQLLNLKKLCSHTIDKYSDTLLTLIEDVLDSDVDSYPQLLPRPLSKEQRHVIKLLKAEVERIATANCLPSGLLACKKDYELLLHSETNNTDYQLPKSLRNWRQPLLEKPLLALLVDYSKNLPAG